MPLEWHKSLSIFIANLKLKTFLFGMMTENAIWLTDELCCLKLKRNVWTSLHRHTFRA